MYIHTFKRGELDQLASAFQILLEGNLLGKEKPAAVRLLSKFKRARIERGQDYTEVYTSDDEEDLLQQVEDSLWKR